MFRALFLSRTLALDAFVETVERRIGQEIADHDHLRRGCRQFGALRQLRLAHHDVRPLGDRVDRAVGDAHAAAQRFDALAETCGPHRTRPHAGIAGEDHRADRSARRTGRTVGTADDLAVGLADRVHLLQLRPLDDRRGHEERHGRRDDHTGQHPRISPFGAMASTAMMLPGEATAVSPVPVSE